jgi:GGDEF domain-containing protein
MNLHQYNPDTRLKLYPALLGIWLILSSFGMAMLDPRTAILSMALMAFTVAMALSGLFRFSGWLAAIISLAVFVYIKYIQVGLSPAAYQISLVFAGVILGTALLSMLTVRWVGKLIGQLLHNHEMVEELAIYDPDTKLMKWVYAGQRVRVEISRSQRYQRDLCLLLVQPESWKDLQTGAAQIDTKTVMNISANLLTATLRKTDIAFYKDGIGALLSETRPEGARVVAQRLVELARGQQISLHVGISHFPTDAVSLEGMVRTAEAALQLAATSNQSIVYYTQLQYAAEGGLSASDDIIEPKALGDTEASYQSAIDIDINQWQNSAAGLPSGKIILGIKGLSRVGKIEQIENFLRQQPEIKTVHLLRYNSGLLLFKLDTPTAELQPLLDRICANLGSNSIEQGPGWVELEVEDVNADEEIAQ